MNKTKFKILQSAITLFNRNGLSNVRNQDIAEYSKISLSNFNYHFGNKQDLVLAVVDYMKEVLEERVYGNKILVQAGQGLQITKAYFEYERDFRFFYYDTYNILKMYPALRVPVQKQISDAIQIIKNLNYMAIGMGYMQQEPTEKPGLYDSLAEQIWINNHFWFTQASIRSFENGIVKKGIEACFCITYPYLTENGKAYYEEFIAKLPDND